MPTDCCLTDEEAGRLDAAPHSIAGHCDVRVVTGGLYDRLGIVCRERYRHKRIDDGKT